MYFWIDEFEVGVNDSIFSGNDQRNVLYVIVRSTMCYFHHHIVKYNDDCFF